MLTQEELKEVLKYNSTTGEFTWKIGIGKRIKAHTLAGSLKKNGYIHIGVLKKTYQMHRLVWLYCYGNFPEGIIDHIDGDGSNNRIQNLRVCTHGENQKNRKMTCTSKSGFKGVTWHKGAKKWRALAVLNRRIVHLGYFDMPEEASKVYNDFCKIHHGEFYRDTTK